MVDPRLRVHGVEQALRVIDASIFPANISGNTNAAAIVTGAKGADMVLEDHGWQDPQQEARMKITDVKTWVVGNPPPGIGGRYFIFVKLTTDGGVVGYGEAYNATFGPHVTAQDDRGPAPSAISSAAIRTTSRTSSAAPIRQASRSARTFR